MTLPARPDDDVVSLDLGGRHEVAPRGWGGPVDGDAGDPGLRSILEHLRRPALRALLPVVPLLLLLTATSGPQPRSVPQQQDVRVTLVAGPLLEHTLDTLTVTGRISSTASFPVEIRSARLTGSPDPGILTPPSRVAPGGAADLTLLVQPDCARGDHGLFVEMAAAGGSTSTKLQVAGAASAYGQLCPPTERGTHAAVTGSRVDYTGTGVEVRVVNRGTMPFLLGPAGPDGTDGLGGLGGRRSRSVIESGTGLTVAELNGLDSAPPSPLSSYPPLPLVLSPGQAVVLMLRPNVDPCALDAAAATVQVGGPTGRQPVEGDVELQRELLLAARTLCAQRST